MKVIIVGGGIAGLTAGVYARQSGIEAEIYEMHSIPGGNSTSWKRKNYFFEGGMHWLTGSSKDTALRELWDEVGALKENNPIYNKDPFLTYENGRESICLYRDPDRLREHLLSVSPEDKEAIDQLVKDIKSFRKMSMPVVDIKGVKVRKKRSMPFGMLFSMLGALRRMGQLNTMRAEEYAAKFKHPGIRTVMNSIVGKGDFSASSVAFTLATLAAGDGGYPKGGSLRMARNIADTFESLGGTILYKRKVERVEIRDGKAVGVWVDGVLHKADAVIVTVDARAAIDTLFKKPLHDEWMDTMRQETEPVNNTFISLGVRADLSNIPENILFPLTEPLSYFGITLDCIGFNNYAQFEGYAPEGCTALTCFFGEDTYDEWKAAKEDGTYMQKKQALAEQVIDRLAQVIPETAGKVEVWDVATPLTYERYCGTWRGSWMSVMKPGVRQQEYPLVSDSIQDLYFAGQRMTMPGGLPVALVTGRQAVQHVCKKGDRVFQSKV